MLLPSRHDRIRSNMRTNLYTKVFFFCCLFAIILLLTSMSMTHVNYTKDTSDYEHILSDNVYNSTGNTIYILEWTSPTTEPFVFLGVGQEGFQRRNCKYTNCYVTADRKYLQNLTRFDVILFHGPEVRTISNTNLPAVRSPRQKYVFASMESSHYYPICSARLDNFFNWTWTFRLDSDARWGYMLVKDANNTIIGPNKIMHWIKLEDMNPVDELFKEKLKSKRKAAAWFVSNCNDLSGRMKFANALKVELAKFGLGLDIYGACGHLKCSRANENECDKIIDEQYYFYLSFENSYSEDYVTEKLLTALKNNAVPIVYGGANYTRFMPDGIYLNAKEMGVVSLATKMNDLINSHDEYAEYYRWKNHYSFHSREEDPENDEYCGFCELLNNETRMSETTTIEHFKEWWDNPNYC